MNMKAENIIRHPLQVPIEIQAMGDDAAGHYPVQDAMQSSLGELAVQCNSVFAIGAEVRLCLPTFDFNAELCGQVIWFRKSGEGYLLGVSFHSEDEAFRMRMVEQICHIEAYHKDIHTYEGRSLSREEAAAEWIARYSRDFPEIYPVCAH